MNFNYEDSSDRKKNVDLNLNRNLKSNYKISDSKIFLQYFSKIDYIYNQVYTCTGKVEQVLLHSLFYIFIIYFFIEKNNKECQKINKKIKEIYSKGIYILSLADLAIINLFQGLNYQQYLSSEEPYSKSVMLFLMLFGDPRGRNNDSHPLLQLPLWKIARKTLKLEKGQPSINQYFLEIYKSLEYFEKDKGKLKIENNKTYFDYEKNIMNNIKNIFKIYEINLNKKGKLDDNNNLNDIDLSLLNNYLNKDIFLSNKIFSDELLNIYCINNLDFLSIEDNSKNVLKKIYSVDFIIYLFKQVQSVLFGKYKMFDDKYINSVICENVFKIHEEEKKNKFK